MTTAQVVSGLNKGTIIVNPLAIKYHCGCAMSGEFIFNKTNSYFTVGGGTTFNWKGYNWRLVSVINKEGTKVIRREAQANGTYINGINFNPSQKLINRAKKHLLFLESHFTPSYIRKIKEYQLKQPLLIENKFGNVN